MKLSLNAGAMEYDERSKKNNSIYIGDYSRELSELGVRNSNSLEQRKKLKEGSLIEIKRSSTRLEKFVSGKMQELEKEIKLKRKEELKDAIYSTDIKEIRKTKKGMDLKKNIEIDLIMKELVDYEKIDNFFNHRIQKLIDKADYDKIREILVIFQTNDKEKSNDLQNNSDNPTDYLDDFALIFIYAKTMCFNNYKYPIELNKKISDEQRQKIRNFYSRLADSKGIDIDKIIIIGKEKKEKLEIDAEILIKMILYNFAKEYYTRIERADNEYWENEIGIEFIKKGNPGNYYSKYLKAIIHVFFDYIEHYKLFNTSDIKEKYSFIGQLFEIAGDPARFNERRGSYKDEADYFYKRLRKYWQYKGTK